MYVKRKSLLLSKPLYLPYTPEGSKHRPGRFYRFGQEPRCVL